MCLEKTRPSIFGFSETLSGCVSSRRGGKGELDNELRAESKLHPVSKFAPRPPFLVKSNQIMKLFKAVYLYFAVEIHSKLFSEKTIFHPNVLIYHELTLRLSLPARV